MSRVTSRKRPTLEEELAVIGVALRDPSSAAHQDLMRQTLMSGRSIPAAQVAAAIASHRLGGFEDALQQSFSRFLRNPIKSDPGCRAKIAVLDALDHLEWPDAAPFVVGARCVQKEPSWGPPIDTAAGVRSRAIVALARIGFSDLLLVAAELLSDPLPSVRRATAEALAHHGERDGASLLLLQLRTGEKDDQVTLACADALISLAPDWALRELEPILYGASESRREDAAIALGQSGREDALALLLAYLERAASPDDRAPILRAVGIHRSERAREFLLERIATGSAPEAKAALGALGARSFEPRLQTLAREAARRNDRVDLEGAIGEVFSK